MPAPAAWQTTQLVALSRTLTSELSQSFPRDTLNLESKMLSKRIAIALAVILAVICLAEAREENPHDVADALRILQELDRYYTQAARPRIDRRDAGQGDRVDPELLDRAMRLIQLQNLDRYYSYHTRPRYGKRSDALTNWAKDLEKPDLPAWLAYARRR